MMQGFAARAAVVAALAPLLAACGDSLAGTLAGTDCGPLPYFTALPVSLSDFDLNVVIGGLGAPGHTLPTAHSGFYLSRAGVAVSSPGDIQVRRIRRVTYVQSPGRQGEEDYAVEFNVCKDVEGWFGHLTSLSDAIPLDTGNESCQTYSTSDETVQACFSDVHDVTLSAGEPMGTGGLSAERGFLELDFGLLDFRVSNYYAAPSRHPSNSFHAVCPYDYFDAANREVLLSTIADPGRFSEAPSGEPRCGTMEVDVAGTAKGVWAEVGVTGPLAGDETRYVTLANYPYRPEDKLALSLGPLELGARVVVVRREEDGRMNRAFEDVTPDGLVYCYNSSDLSSFGNSWFISLNTDGQLMIERIEHPGEDTPCRSDPETWRVGVDALAFVR